MAWFPSKIWTVFIILLTTLMVLSLSDQLPDEKSHCTADSCDSDDDLKFEDETDEEELHCKDDSCDSDDDLKFEDETDEEEEPGVHIEYSCASPDFVPEEGTPVIFLHGLSDSRHTWNGIYQNIPILTHRKACVYDARNHGDSDWNDTFNLEVLAEDLGRLIEKLKIERAVLVGHSMGGLTAMEFALRNPSKVDKLFVEDISPIGIPKSAKNFAAGFFDILYKSVSVIPEGADENTAKTTVRDYITEAIHQSLPENFFEHVLLHQKDGVWQWKANFDVIQKAVATSDKTLAVRLQGRYAGKALFIYGKLSMFGVGEHEELIRKYFPQAEFVGVKGASHDIHFHHRQFQTELIKFLE